MSRWATDWFSFDTVPCKSAPTRFTFGCLETAKWPGEMGTSSDNLDKIRWLYNQGLFRMPAAIADIGCQQLSHSTNQSVRTFAGILDAGAMKKCSPAFDHYSYMGDLSRRRVSIT